MEDKDTKSRPVSTELPLRDAVAIAGRFTAKANLIPVLSCVLIMPDGMIAATNSSRRAEIQTDARIAAPICVDAANLAKALGKSGSYDITVDGMTLVVERGKTRSVIAGLPHDEFPEAPALIGGQTEFEIDAANFVGACETAGGFASRIDARYYLCGAHVEISNKIHIVATDGHRLFWQELDRADAYEPTDPDRTGIIPTEMLAIMRGAFGKSDTLSVKISDREIRVEAGASTISSVLIEGAYPDWRRIISMGGEGIEFHCDSDEMAEALAAVSWACGREGDATIARIAIDPDAIIASAWSVSGSANSAESGISHAAPPVTDGDGFQFLCNFKYMSEICAAYKGVIVKVTSSGKSCPLKIVSAGVPGRTCILMPVRG